MPEPAASLFSRSGLRSYLRRVLGLADVSGVALAADVVREVGRATKTLRVDLDDTKEEQRKFRHDTREQLDDLRERLKRLEAASGAPPVERQK